MVIVEYGGNKKPTLAACKKILEKIELLIRCIDARVSQIEKAYVEQSVALHTAYDRGNAIVDLESYVPATALQNPAQKHLICCG